MLVDGVIQLPKEQVLPKGRREVPVVLRQIRRVERRIAGWRLNGDAAGAVLVIAFIGAKGEEPVADQRTPSAHRRKHAGIVGYFECGRSAVREPDTVRPMLVLEGECVQREQALVLIAKQDVPGPLIRPGARGRVNDRARRLLIFCLEILTDNAVFLDRAAGERIAPAIVLPAYTTRRQVVLETGTVDKHVGRIRA